MTNSQGFSSANPYLNNTPNTTPYGTPVSNNSNGSGVSTRYGNISNASGGGSSSSGSSNSSNPVPNPSPEVDYVVTPSPNSNETYTPVSKGSPPQNSYKVNTPNGVVYRVNNARGFTDYDSNGVPIKTTTSEQTITYGRASSSSMSVNPNNAQQQEYLSKFQGTTFVNSQGQGFSQNPNSVVTNIQENIFGVAKVSYASGKNESYVNEGNYGNDNYVPLASNFSYDYTKQIASNQPLTMEQLNNQRLDLSQEYTQAISKGGVINVAGGLAIGLVYAGTRAGTEVLNTPKYALEFVSGYNFDTKRQGIPIVSSVYETAISLKYIPQAFSQDPFGTAGSIAGNIIGIEALGKVSKVSGFDSVIGESLARIERTGYDFKSIPTLKDFYNVRAGTERYQGIEFAGFKVKDTAFDITPNVKNDIVLYRGVNVRPSNPNFQGFSAYSDYVDVPSGVKVNFEDFSIQKSNSIRNPVLKLDSSYRPPLQITKDTNFIDLVSLSQEYKRGNYKPKISEGIPLSAVMKPSQDFINVNRFTKQGYEIDYRTKNVIPINSQIIAIPEKAFTKFLRRNKSLRAEPVTDLRIRVPKETSVSNQLLKSERFVNVNRFTKQGYEIDYRTKNVIPVNSQIIAIPEKAFTKFLRRTNKSKNNFVDFSKIFEEKNLNFKKNTLITSTSKALRRNKSLRESPLNELPTSALYPLDVMKAKPKKINFIKFIEPKKQNINIPKEEKITRSGQVLILKPPKLEGKRIVRFLKKRTARGEFKPSYQSSYISGQTTQDLVLYGVSMPSDKSIPKYEFGTFSIRNFGYGKMNYANVQPILLNKHSPIVKNINNISPKTFNQPILKQRVNQIQTNVQKFDRTQRIKNTPKIEFMLKQEQIQKQEQKQKQSQKQEQVQRQIQKQFQRQKLDSKLRMRTPSIKIPQIMNLRLNPESKKPEKTFKIPKINLNLKSKKGKEKLDILPSLRNVFIYEGMTGKEAKKPKQTKKIKKIFYEQYFGKGNFNTLIPVYQKQKF